MAETDSVAASTRVPGTYVRYDVSRAGRALGTGEQRLLIIAQRLSTGSVPALTPVDIFSGDEAAAAFGRGSQAHRMVEKAINANGNLQLSVCALEDDASGVAASGAIIIEGVATSSGQVRLRIGDVQVATAVTLGDKAAEIMTHLVSVIAAMPDLPVTAAVGTAVTGQDHENHNTSAPAIVLTARHKGTGGNETGLILAVDALGVTGKLQVMAGGKGDPKIETALSAVFSAGHTLIAVPYSGADSLGKLSAHLDKVSGPVEQRAAIAVSGFRGTLAAGTTLTNTVNAARITTGWHKNSALTCGELAAVYAAVIAAQDDPSEPMDNTVLPGLDITAQSDWPMRTEEENALHNGLTPFRVLGTRVQVVRAISTYVKNAASVKDATLLDITTLRTLDAVRVAWRTRMAQRYPNGGKLTDARLRSIRSETLDVLYALQGLDMVEHIDRYKDQVTVVRNARDDTRADVAIPAPVVRGLHILTGTIYLY
ncbi:phage tail sheath C-terminal domain-containing protein [Serratia bockelmannii]|uniref:phage tail sheath C-terminal domain-containing protein n=1 Tax=Serratia bockelmannii TaxID=2703793 RepID=UPI003FA7E1B2